MGEGLAQSEVEVRSSAAEVPAIRKMIRSRHSPPS